MQRTARVQVAWPSRGGAQLAGRTFTIRSLQDFLNLSRGALRHYESIGLLVPERDEESGYRIYSNKDAYKILDYIIYQTAGGAAREARELLVDDGVDAAKFVDCCQNEVERRIAWYRAVRESLDRLAAIGRGECTGAPRLVMDDVWWLYYDRGEKGYGSFEANEALDILLDGMPISSLGAVFDGDLFTQGLEGTRWYRAVPERHVDLFPRLRELGYEYRRLGGGLHIVATYTEVVGTGRGFDDTYRIRGQVAAFMEKYRLELSGTPFFANSWPIREAFYLEMHVPVRAAGPFASVRQRRLERAAIRTGRLAG